MTTYSYTIKLNDSESITLQAALELMLKECEKQLANGPKAPYWAYKHYSKTILAKLNDDIDLVSYSNWTED